MNSHYFVITVSTTEARTTTARTTIATTSDTISLKSSFKKGVHFTIEKVTVESNLENEKIF